MSKKSAIVSAVDTVQTYVNEHLDLKRRATELEKLKPVVIEAVTDHGARKTSSTIEMVVGGAVVQVQSKVMVSVNMEALIKVLKKYRKLAKVTDTVTTETINQEKVLALVNLGELPKEEVDACLISTEMKPSLVIRGDR